MARFPRQEAEIRTLARSMAAGLAADAADFPAPPVSAADLQALLDSLVVLCDEQVAAQAAAEQATRAKVAGLAELVTALRTDIRYAEAAVDFDDAKLTALGWGGRAAPTALEVPGQPRQLAASHQGEDWVALQWKKPTGGGAVAAYKIEYRRPPANPWTLVGMAFGSEIRLADQERGSNLEYRVIATNKAGESLPSNTVAAVL